MLKGLLEAFGIYKLYERWLHAQIRNKPMPLHVGLILDGNRRWAISRGLPSWMGHVQGAQKLEELLEWCYQLGIKILTLYVLSTENLARSQQELQMIFELLERKSREALERIFELNQKGVRVKLLGKLELIPDQLRSMLMELESRTQHNSRLYLNVAIAYGGRAEIVDAIKQILKDALAGKLDPAQLDEQKVSSYMYTSELPKPEPDLIIRTSGEERLSNFLLWQSAYSELYFCDVYWPGFRKIDFLRAIRSYQHRSRRFGR